MFKSSFMMVSYIRSSNWLGIKYFPCHEEKWDSPSMHWLSGTSITFVQQTITQPHSLNRLLMIMPIVKYTYPWMASMDIIKSTFSYLINLRLNLFVPRVHLLIANSHLIWRMLGPHFNRKWIMLFMILNILCITIWMISICIPSMKIITQCISGPFS